MSDKVKAAPKAEPKEAPAPVGAQQFIERKSSDGAHWTKQPSSLEFPADSGVQVEQGYVGPKPA